MTLASTSEQTLEVTKHVEIHAPIDLVWESILEEMGPLNQRGDGVAMPMTLETWPGGRWFRDLGDQNGHYWGTVQAIRRHDLLEIHGPLFMSAPVVSHVLYRLSQQGGVTCVEFSHRAVGPIPAPLVDGTAVNAGWGGLLERVRLNAERRAK